MVEFRTKVVAKIADTRKAQKVSRVGKNSKI